MRKYVSILVAVAALFGCGDDDDDDRDVVDVRAWQAAILGTGDNTALRGESEVTQLPDEDQFTAAIDLRNDVPGSIRPWHVHFGTCGSGGAIVGTDEDYPRLVIDEDGSASASVTIQETLDPRSSYHVNVHRADDELEIIIACGNLRLAPLPLDGGVVSDAAADAGIATDAAGPDAAMAPDAEVTQDAATIPDAATTPDAAVTPDATVTSDAAPGTETIYP